MKKYRLTRKRHVRNKGLDKDGEVVREIINKGDIFYPTEGELRAFGDRMELVSDDVRVVGEPVAEKPLPVPEPEPEPEPQEVEVEPEEKPKPKAKKVTDKQLANMSVPEIRRLLSTGAVEPERVIRVEKANRKRVTLLNELRKQLPTE
jgi:hypothetical protein